MPWLKLQCDHNVKVWVSEAMKNRVWPNCRHRLGKRGSRQFIRKQNGKLTSIADGDQNQNTGKYWEKHGEHLLTHQTSKEKTEYTNLNTQWRAG